MKQSEWMKGLLWAEDYINHFKGKHNTEKDVIDVYEYYEHPNKATGDLVSGVFDYLKHYEERLK